MKINILGTEYKVEYRKHGDDENLQNCDGYIDTSIKLIVVEDIQPEAGNKKDLKSYQKQVLRHEVIHAYLFESGLDVNCTVNGSWATNEEVVDWFAIQSPKIFKTYQECDCI